MDLVLAVAGDRHYTDYKTFSKILQDELERFPATMVVTGDASGVDTMVYTYCSINNIPVRVFCASRANYQRFIREGVDTILAADWQKDHHAAGPIRNARMLEDANKLLVFDGGGKGSASVLKIAKAMSKDIERWVIDKPTNFGATGTGFAVHDGRNSVGGSL